MKAIFKKEMRWMLSSMSLMLAVAVFFILVGLWLWFFPQTSIVDNKFSTLQTLFDIAPWLFLFIIPSLTMRSISEEKVLGTLDIIHSKPITMWSFVMGKFLAVMVLVFIMMLLCQIYTYSVYQLGFPKGNLDTGGTLGSFIGWFLLAACFTAIGVFASAISSSQMIAFLIAVLLCFLLFIGPAFISTLPVFQGNFDTAIIWLGIESHYEALSKGAITTSDIFYLLGITLIFLFLASQYLDKFISKFSLRSVLHFPFLIGTALLVLSVFNFYTIDLTGDKRYTLSKETRSLLTKTEDIVYAELLMDSKLPAAFTRLRNATIEKLKDFNRINRNIQYSEVDPLEGSKEDIKANQERLRKDGISPTQLTVYNGKEQEKKVIYPYVIFHFGERIIPVNLLEAQDPNIGEDEILNRSVSLLEYKFANAIQKLRMTKNPVVVFTRGHGELSMFQTADLERTLRPVYSTGRITLDSVVQISNEIDVLIIAKPQTAFSTRDNFLIDQYVMNGGKIIWFIDPLFVNTDTVNASNRRQQDFIPMPYDLNIDELLFKYGCRVQPNAVLDYECSTLPLLVGYNAGAPQFEPRPWYYHPLIAPTSSHPIVKNLDRISTFYPATLDTLRTKTPVQKEIILATSNHSRTITSPSPINFEMVRNEVLPDQFNRPSQPIGLLLQGIFPSAFENRVSESFSAGLKQMNSVYKSESVPNKMLVFSDGDLAANVISSRGEPAPLGFNMYEQKTYPSNKNLVLNSIEYMIDESNIMSARNKEVKLRLLDESKLKKQKAIWQWINLIFPALLSMIIYLAFDLYRKKKYAF